MTYAVILAGSIVRGTGAGLGCPDWPRCFGNWIPPVHVSELPADYKEQFKVAGRMIADFDAFKTWTEYINRLLGAILGFMILVLFLKSFKYKDHEPNLPWYVFGLLLLVSIQGGIGAFVVSTHLKPWLVSIHMLIAIVMLFYTHTLNHYLFELGLTAIRFPRDQKNIFWTKILIFFALVQVLLGTQVRENVDNLLMSNMNLAVSDVGHELGLIFYIHRSFSVIFLITLVISLVSLYKSDISGICFKRGLLILLLVLSNVATGIGLNYFGFPANLQPPHLLIGVLIIGFLFEQYLSQKGTIL